MDICLSLQPSLLFYVLFEFVSRRNIILNVVSSLSKRTQMTKTRILSPTRFLSPKSLSSGDSNFMEQLLLHCATAIDSNDAALTHQILWVLNDIAPPNGDSSTRRLTSAFVRALFSRAVSKIPTLSTVSFLPPPDELHRFSVVELAAFVDLTPWHRFGFMAANAAILTAVEGYSTVHIVDLSLTHCMQIPTLIDAMASRLNKPPPLLKLTVVSSSEDFPPLINISYEELGSKLVNFATTRNITMEFTIIPSTYSDGFSSLLQQLRIHTPSFNEALVVNCHMMLRYIPEETLTSSSSLRTVFLKQLHSLNPTIVTLIEEDADLTSGNLLTRLRLAFNYFWIPFDTTDTFMSEQRRLYEAEISWKIENVVAKEGVERVERTETKRRWIERMREASFGAIRVKEDVADVKLMLEEHGVGWGMKKEDDDLSLVLTWKGHSVVFATVWLPI